MYIDCIYIYIHMYMRICIHMQIEGYVYLYLQMYIHILAFEPQSCHGTPNWTLYEADPAQELSWRVSYRTLHDLMGATQKLLMDSLVTL